MINGILSKRLKFSDAYKLYMRKPDLFLENETRKILWDKQTDNQTLTRRPDIVLNKKKKITCYLVDFTVPENHTLKMKGKKDRQKLGS